MDSISETSRRVHALVDRLPPSQVAALEGLLQSMIDPGAAGGPEHIEELVEPDRGAAGGFSFEELVEECGVSDDQIRQVQSEHGTVRKIRFEPTSPAGDDLD